MEIYVPSVGDNGKPSRGENDTGDRWQQGKRVHARLSLWRSEPHPNAPRQVISAAVDAFGAIDALVVNHAHSSDQSPETASAEGLDRAWAVMFALRFSWCRRLPRITTMIEPRADRAIHLRPAPRPDAG